MSSDLGTIFGSGGLVISIISMVYAAINHKRIRAKCCGRSVDFEINIDPTEHASAQEQKKEESKTEQKTTPKIGFDTLREIKNLQILTKKPVRILPEPDADTAKPVRVKPRVWADEEDDSADLDTAYTGVRRNSTSAAGLDLERGYRH